MAEQVETVCMEAAEGHVGRIWGKECERRIFFLIRFVKTASSPCIPVLNSYRRQKPVRHYRAMPGGFAFRKEMLYGVLYFTIFFNFLFRSFGL